MMIDRSPRQSSSSRSNTWFRSLIWHQPPGFRRTIIIILLVGLVLCERFGNEGVVVLRGANRVQGKSMISGLLLICVWWVCMPSTGSSLLPPLFLIPLVPPYSCLALVSSCIDPALTFPLLCSAPRSPRTSPYPLSNTSWRLIVLGSRWRWRHCLLRATCCDHARRVVSALARHWTMSSVSQIREIHRNSLIYILYLNIKFGSVPLHCRGTMHAQGGRLIFHPVRLNRDRVLFCVTNAFSVFVSQRIASYYKLKYSVTLQQRIFVV